MIGARGVGAAVLSGCLLLAACGSGTTSSGDDAVDPDAPVARKGSEETTTARERAVKSPGKLTDPLLSSDVLVVAKDTLSDDVVKRIGRLKGVTHTETFALGQFFHEETGVTYAAVDPSTFRRLTPPGTAQTLEVWKRVAGGEMAITPRLGLQLQDKAGYVAMGPAKAATRVHVGAYAEITAPEINPATRIDAVLNEKWIEPLRMKRDNAMIFSMGSASPQSIRKDLLQITGTEASVQILGPDLDIDAAQTAVLTGGSVAAAVGSFTYTVSGGTVTPQASWVSANIRDEVLPVVGRVRCHRVMLAQLRQVMLEVQSRGVADKIYDYGGCYVPRYIAGSSTLSFHSFGTAIDLNVQDNLRGTAGKMDRQVVEIFRKWGFNWGGTWGYTDPMHFELARIVRSG